MRRRLVQAPLTCQLRLQKIYHWFQYSRRLVVVGLLVIISGRLPYLVISVFKVASFHGLRLVPV